MSFLKLFNKDSIENLMNSEEFKKWIYSKRWFGEKSQLLNLEFQVSLDFFKFITENISLTIIKVLKSNYERSYFLPLIYYKNKEEIQNFSEQAFNIIVSFKDKNKKKEISLILLEAEYSVNFWKNILFKKDIYNDFSNLSLDIQDNPSKKRFENLFSNDVNYYKLELEQLGKGNTTNLIFRLTLKNKEMNSISFVAKSYRVFSERIEQMTLNVLAKNQFAGVPKLNAKIDLKDINLISIMEYMPNQGNIGEIYWNELNNMIYELLSNYDEKLGSFKDNNNFLTLTKNKCENSFTIAKNIGVFIKSFHKAVVLEDNVFYSSEMIERDYFLRNFSQKLLLIISEIQYMIENNSRKSFLTAPKINSLLFEIADRIQELCTSIDKSGIIIQPIHQDLHMEQILYDKTDNNFNFYIIDLEGDPNFTFEEKQKKYPKERDIASFLRSLSYIKYNTFLGCVKNQFSGNIYNNPEEFLYDLFFTNKLKKNKKKIDELLKILNIWETELIARFFKNLDYDKKLIDYFLIDRIIHEINYEINFRPSKVIIPILGLKEYLNK
ncbi:MAG: hypothetical protein KGD57_05425 [Candidatus Lokiarchaeota archaeon]|nr:hypothetical protein [Candidatus Lokiarchaeota archaeon]